MFEKKTQNLFLERIKRETFKLHNMSLSLANYIGIKYFTEFYSNIKPL